MNLLPVIGRELRATSRQSASYWLRVYGAAAALLAILVQAFGALQDTNPGSGAEVFSVVHETLFFSILLGVPWLVGDCLSRERREGTLGLLFLTALKPAEIVLAKVFVHGLRALSLWLAVLPVMALAFLKGGVGWREAVLSALINFSALCLALGAGLLATAFSKRWLRAMVASTCLAVVAMLLLATVCGGNLPLFRWTRAFRGPVFAGWSGPGPFSPPGMGGAPFGWAPGGMPGMVVSIMSPSFNTLITVGVSLAWLGFAIILAALRLRSLGREEPTPEWLVRIHDYFCLPRYGKGLLARWMKWQIERNPVGWLENRTWTGRLVIWGWFAIIVGIYSGVFSAPMIYMRSFDTIQTVLGGTLLLFVCTSAAGSFQRERETGVLELLLVSPTNEGRIIGGRVRGIWGRFFPAMALLVVIWLSFPRMLGNREPGGSIVFMISSYLTLPVVGLYQSLRRNHFISALLWTVAMGAVLPYLVASILVEQRFDDARLTLAFLLQLMIAARCGQVLHRNLTQRKFALEQGANQ